MPYRTSGREHVAAAMAAATAIWAAAASCAAADGGDRSVTSHILIGVSPQTAFSVLAEGDQADGSPAVSDSLGILTFSVSDSGLPPGPLTVTVVPAGAAPVISGLVVEDVTPTAAVVRWTTDGPATSQVEYGPSPDHGSVSSLDGDLVTDHSVVLDGLDPGTQYFVSALSTGPDGLPATPASSSFETLPVAQTGPPIIGGVSVRPVSSMFVMIIWVTDRPATSQVRYGTKGILDLATAVDTTLVSDHRVLVGPVAPQVEYSFVSLSACGSDTASCDPGVFESLGFLSIVLEAKAPRVTKAGVHDVQDTCAVVRWATDRPCSTWVECGRSGAPEVCCTGAALGVCGYEAVMDGLAPNTAYTYRVCAIDEAGAFATSEPDTFTTAPLRKDAEPGEPCDATTCVQDEWGGDAALAFSLGPNPAASDAVLMFSLPEPTRVRANVFSTAGRLVRTLTDREWPAGAHALPWDLSSSDGRPVASGAYLCAIEAGDAFLTRKLVVVR